MVISNGLLSVDNHMESFFFFFLNIHACKKIKVLNKNFELVEKTQPLPKIQLTSPRGPVSAPLRLIPAHGPSPHAAGPALPALFLPVGRRAWPTTISAAPGAGWRLVVAPVPTDVGGGGVAPRRGDRGGNGGLRWPHAALADAEGVLPDLGAIVNGWAPHGVFAPFWWGFVHFPGGVLVDSLQRYNRSV